jgi:hypothetical protein
MDGVREKDDPIWYWLYPIALFKYVRIDPDQNSEANDRGNARQRDLYALRRYKDQY